MCGTFTGMSSPALFPSVRWALGAGVLTSLLYETLIHMRGWALGLGGRYVRVLHASIGLLIGFSHLNRTTTTNSLGAIAFLAVNAIALVQGINGLATASFVWPTLAPAAFKLGTPLSITVGFTALGALATIVLREASDDQPVVDPVRAAAVTGTHYCR